MKVDFYTLDNDSVRRAAISFGGNVAYSKSVTEWEQIANLILSEIRRDRATQATDDEDDEQWNGCEHPCDEYLLMGPDCLCECVRNALR